MICKDFTLTGNCRPRFSFFGRVYLQVEEAYQYGRANPYNKEWKTVTRWRNALPEDFVKDMSKFSIGLKYINAPD